MDAFYASVEQLDDPELKGKPVAVGGNEERGVISAASYEARKFGIRSAMSSKQAAKLCPALIFVKPRFWRYKEISTRIREIFYRYTDLVEPLSLDEAFLDVTDNKLGIPSATFAAQSIRNDIRMELGLTASAGVSYNKFLAKIASDQDKPDGLFVITHENAQSVLDELPVGQFFGVGKVMEEKLHELNIRTGRDLRRLSQNELTQYFGKSGKYLYDIARGIDDRNVSTDHNRKSMAFENTFDHDIQDHTGFYLESSKILDGLWERYTRYDRKGRTLTMKVKYADFSVRSRSRTSEEVINDHKALKDLAEQLADQFIPLEKPVRLIGFQISGFESSEAKQLHLSL
jgi:DNA polymerase-4